MWNPDSKQFYAVFVFCGNRILNSFLQYLFFVNPDYKQFCAMHVVYKVLILLKSCDSCVLRYPDSKYFVQYLCFVESRS